MMMIDKNLFDCMMEKNMKWGHTGFNDRISSVVSQLSCFFMGIHGGI